MSLSFDIEVVDSRRSSMTQYGEGLGGDDADLLEQVNGLLDGPPVGFRLGAGGLSAAERAIGGITPAAGFAQPSSGALDAQDESDEYGDYNDPFEQSVGPPGASPSRGVGGSMAFCGGLSSVSAAASEKASNEPHLAESDLQMASFMDTPTGPESQSQKGPALSAAAVVVRRTSVESCSSSDSGSGGEDTAARAAAAKMASAARRTESPPPRHEETGAEDQPYIPVFSSQKPRSHSIINKDLIPSMPFTPAPAQTVPEACPISPQANVPPTSPPPSPPVDEADGSQEQTEATVVVSPVEPPAAGRHADVEASACAADADDTDPYDFDFSTDLTDLSVRPEADLAPVNEPAAPMDTGGDSPPPRVGSSAETERRVDGAAQHEVQDPYDFDFDTDLRDDLVDTARDDVAGATAEPPDTHPDTPPAPQGVGSAGTEDVESDPYDFDFSTDLGDAVVGGDKTAISEPVHSPPAEPPVVDDSAESTRPSSRAPVHEGGSEEHLLDSSGAEAVLPVAEARPMDSPLPAAMTGSGDEADAEAADPTLLRPTTSASANGATGQSKYEYSYEDEFEDEWEDGEDAGSSNDEGHADAVFVDEATGENDTDDALPTAGEGACVLPEEPADPVATKPRSADQSTSEFRFSRRFLDKKKRMESARVKLQPQTERRKSEGHKQGKRRNSSDTAAPTIPAVPKFKQPRSGSSGRVQSRGSSGKSGQRDQQLKLLREGKELYSKRPVEQKNERDDSVRRKLLHDIEEAKRAYLKECVESGVPADGKILLSLEDLASSDRPEYRPDAQPEKPRRRPSSDRPPVDSPRRGRSLKPPVPRPPWGGHKPRVVLGAGGQPVLAPSRSVAVSSVRSSPMKTQLSDEGDVKSNAHVDTVTFKEPQAAPEKLTCNGFGELLEEQPPQKKGGWPSPRYKATGTPKPGQANINRFIVAPSTFIKAPKQAKQVVNFYAAPIKFPIFRPAAPRRDAAPEGTPEEQQRSVTFRTCAAPGPAVSTSPSQSPARARDSYPSPSSPIKAKIAAAVASATAAAQNVGDAPLDVDALMRSLAALGNELQPSPQTSSKNTSRAEQHTEKMKQLLHILNPHLEEAYVSLMKESRALDEKTPVRIKTPDPPPKPLSKKEQKELAVQARLEKMAKQFLTEKEYEERQKRKADQLEKRAAFFENLEAKKKVEKETKKKEAARQKHVQRAKKILQEAVDKMPIEETETPATAGAQISASEGIVAKPATGGKPGDGGPTKVPKHDRNDLIAAVQVATATVTEENAHATSQHQRLNEKMLEQQLIRQQILYEEEMGKQKEMLEQQIREKERLQAQLRQQYPQESTAKEAEDGGTDDEERDTSTAGQPTIIMMTKLSPRKDKIVSTQVEAVSHAYDSTTADEEAVPESPVSPGRSSTGVIRFVEMADRSPSDRDVRSDGTDHRGGARRKIDARGKYSHRADTGKYMDSVGHVVINHRNEHAARVVKELPKPHGPAQRAVNAITAFDPVAAQQSMSTKVDRGEADGSTDNLRSNQTENGPKMYNQYKTVAVPPAEPLPSSQRGINSASRKLVPRGGTSRGSSAINMNDFYDQIALTASQQLPMDSMQTRKKGDKADSPRLPSVTSNKNVNGKESTTDTKRRNREEEEEEYNRYYSDIFEEFKQSYN